MYIQLCRILLDFTSLKYRSIFLIQKQPLIHISISIYLRLNSLKKINERFSLKNFWTKLKCVYKFGLSGYLISCLSVCPLSNSHKYTRLVVQFIYIIMVYHDMIGIENEVCNVNNSLKMSTQNISFTLRSMEKNRSQDILMMIHYSKYIEIDVHDRGLL